MTSLRTGTLTEAMAADLLSPDDPTLPCLHCNRYTCRCDETLSLDMPAPRQADAVPTVAAPADWAPADWAPADWAPWMSGAAANA
ncbi:MAG: hypothetical protein NVSMB55_08350 [Mycobacteriales bacterium]